MDFSFFVPKLFSVDYSFSDVRIPVDLSKTWISAFPLKCGITVFNGQIRLFDKLQ